MSRIEGQRFHDLRHTFGSRLVQEGADIETVRSLLGHSSITITQRYLHTTGDRTKAAVGLLNGKPEKERKEENLLYIVKWQKIRQMKNLQKNL